jgi:hypothetical protein|tara:strand:- start:120 stop:221 length:102 start_codon:yes stop_codon:yes gene_type:complete
MIDKIIYKILGYLDNLIQRIDNIVINKPKKKKK